MNFQIPNFMPAIPEMFVLIMGCFTLLVEAYSGRKKVNVWVYILVQLTLVVAAFLTFQQLNHPPVVTFEGSFILDNLAILMKLAIYVTSFLAFLYSRTYVAERDILFGEYYVLGLFAVLGMMILVSAYSFLTLFLGLELTSLPVYAMVAMRRDVGTCSEAAIKYFVIGTLATGMLLYGLSMIYGATGSIDIGAVANAISTTPSSQNLILIFGLVFIIVGVAFKLGAVPFHMWVPDVYEGAPSSVTLLIASAPKIAGLGLAIRLLVDGLPDLLFQWQQILIVVSVLSMAIGNIVAIVQSNLKRMLAYSSIAHIGYMLLGLLAGTKEGYAAAVFYIIAYTIMTAGAFGMIVIMSQAGIETENIDDLKGLNSRNPWLAFIMLLIMFSMAGIPPIVGFVAKLGVLEALIQVHLVWLAVVALLFAIIGAYYYIRVVKVMYFEEPEEVTRVTCSKDMQLAMTINGLSVLALGIFPGFLFNLCRSAF